MQSIVESLAPGASRPQRDAASHSRAPLQDALTAVWRFFGAFGQRRAAAEILELANALQATRPETAAQMRRAVARSWD